MQVNNECFTEFGKAWRKGEFTKLNPKSQEWTSLWTEQTRRLVHGYEVGGKWMSGCLYGYVNFGTIDLLDEVTQAKWLGPPMLRDVEWELDRLVEECYQDQMNLIYVSGRRVGKSFYAAFRLWYTATILRQNCLVASGIEEKGNELMQKIEQHYLGIQTTEFSVPILQNSFLDATDGLAFGYEIQSEETNNKFTKNFVGGKIYHRNFKLRTTAANGISAKFAVWEEIGMFEKLIGSFNAAKRCWMDGNRQFGMALLQGTGGDMGKESIGASIMFEEPEVYKCKVFRDVRSPTKKIGLFIPGYYAFNEYRDSEGRVDIDKGKQSIYETREGYRNAKDLTTLDLEMQYCPLTWQEAFLKSGGGRFPQAIIQEQIERITSNSAMSSAGIRGKLEEYSGIISFEPNPDLREPEYPVKPGGKNEGCVVIYEMPYMADGSIPHNLYVAGTDPYAFDTAPTSPSLGSTFIYKRMLDPMKYTHDIIVAEYTGRPELTSEYYEIVRRLLVFYNGRDLYENNVRGLKEYLDNKGQLYLLAPTPPILKDIIPDSQVDRTYGVHAAEKIIRYGNSLIVDYLKEEYAPGHRGVERILSLNLLYELRDYDGEGNFDRVDAFRLVLLQDNSDFKTEIQEQSKDEIGSFHREYFERMGWTTSSNPEPEFLRRESTNQLPYQLLNNQ